MTVYYFLLSILVSITFALLEIQIEGKDGWAEKLPTWRLYKPWFKYIPGGNKSLTGYHLYLWLTIFLLLHVVYLAVPFSVKNELLIMSFMVLTLKLEDFLWFVFNPHYGLKKFNRYHILWHNQWFGPVPVQYWYSLIIWLILFSYAI